LLSNLSTSLLKHKRITTTVAKAKETRSLVEKLITRARRAVAQKDKPEVALHARREVAKLIHDREALKELFSTIAEKVGERAGGYTRVVKLGQRPGDGAEMAVIELVDFNTGQELLGKKETAKEKKAVQPKSAKKGAGAKKEKAEEPKVAEAKS
jgi:large subunit ribosomal protein L17